MKTLFPFFCLFMSGFIGGADAAPVQNSLPPMQTAQHFTFTQRESLNYLLFLPEGYGANP